MPTLHRTIVGACDPDTAFGYLVDFENATEWDSGTQSCTRTSGDGGVGTVYRNVSTFAGRTIELDYTVERIAQPVFVIVGRTATTTSHDTITVRPHPKGCEVDYVAEFTFTGPARFLGPLMRPLLNNLGDKTAAQMAAALDRLAR